MVLRIKLTIILSLFICCLLQTPKCPSGETNYTIAQSIPKQSLQHASEDLESFYLLKNDIEKTQLIGYKVVENVQQSDSSIQIRTFSTDASKTWKINSVSKSGSCVGVVQETKFVAYDTSSNSFVASQTIDLGPFTSVKSVLSQKCEMAYLSIDNSGAVKNKYYLNSKQKSEALYPTDAVFDEKFMYGIDKSGKFYQLKNGVYSSKQLDTNLVKPVPLNVHYSSDFSAVIIITKDSSNGFSILVQDLNDPANFYSEEFKKDSYTGLLKITYEAQDDSLIVQDDSGLKLYLELDISAKKLVFNEFELQKSDFNSLFGLNGHVSSWDGYLFVYNSNSKKTNYFFPFQGVLYNLGSITTQIESSNLKQRLKYVSKDSRLVISFSGPTKLQSCDPTSFSDISTTNNATEEQMIQTDNVSVVISSNGQVGKCDVSCNVCEAGGKCKNCAPGYVLSFGNCVYCNGCKTCNSLNSSICYSCYSPQILDQTNKLCTFPNCIINDCFKCDLSGKCIQCLEGFSLFSNQCKQCQPQGCKSCSAGTNTCDNNSCQAGFIYYTNKKTLKSSCVSCTIGCLGCKSTDISQCSDCLEGFYLAVDFQSINRCYPCISNCSNCTSDTKCVVCSKGYKLNDDKTKCLAKCSDNCLTCDEADQNKCKTCYSGSSLDTKTNECISDLSCNSTSTCISCSIGYVISKSKCYKCTYSDLNCLGCTYPNLNVCTKCSSGYYAKSGSCVKCQAQCSACINKQACYGCSPNYYLSVQKSSSTGKCLKCDSLCKTCQITSTLCTSCYDLFELNNGTCQSPNRLEVSTVIALDLEQLIEVLEDYIAWLIQTSNQNLPAGATAFTRKDYKAKGCRKSSAIINGGLSAVSASYLQSASNGLSTAMSQNPSIGGYSILSGSVITKTNSLGSTNSSSNSSIGLILGVSIPVGTLIIIGISVVIYKLMMRKQQLYKDNGKQDTHDDGSGVPSKDTSMNIHNVQIMENSYHH